MSGNSPLPVEFISFNGIQKNEAVKLNWETASEINNDYYTVEKSLDGIDYKSIATVDGAGNSNVILSYEYQDQNPLNGINYYRIKQTDYNGDFDYTDVIAVTYIFKNTDTKIISASLYENTIDLEAYSSEQKNVQILLYDMMGRQLFSKETTLNVGNNSISIFLSDEQNGILILSVSDLTGSLIGSKKLIK